MELTLENIFSTHGDRPEKILGLEASKLKISRICSLLPLAKLKSINIANNLIESLDYSFIDRLKDLKELDVSCNSLQSTSGILNPGLIKLNIGFNKIESIENLPKVIKNQSLQILRAEGNVIHSTRCLASLNSLKILDLNLNSISQIEGLERIQLEELYLSHNHIREILPIDLPSSLKVLNLRKNSIASVEFLSKVPGLESLNVEDNKLETLTGLPILKDLSELILSSNQIFLLGLSDDISVLLPALYLLDLSSNSLYDRLELISLKKIETLFELSLENNPCTLSPDIVQILSQDYPNISIINNVQVKKLESESRPASRAKSLVTIDDSRARKEIQELNDLISSKRKKCLGVLKDIEHSLEKQFYDEFGLLKGKTFEKGELYVVEEENQEEVDHEDLHEEEQKWFTTQMQWTKKVIERKGAAHRYIKDKDDRPGTSAGKEKNLHSGIKGVNRQRQKLEEAMRFCKG